MNIFGSSVSKELLEVEATDEDLKYKLKGYVSNANYSSKKLIMLLFINHRLVESTAMKKVIENMYSIYIPKNSHPFLYLSLELDPKNVDVNVHPTKYEVHFLHEDLILHRIRQAVEAKLLSSNKSRVFYTQARLPGAAAKPKANNKTPTGPNTNSNSKTPAAKEMVRTDSRDQKLDKFYGSPSTSKLDTTSKADDSKTDSPADPKDSNRTECKLRSVLELRRVVEDRLHVGMRDLLKNSTFVGCVSPKQALIQHETKLYLCNTARLSEELFYQILLYDFQNFGYLKFSDPLPIYDVILMSLDHEDSGWTEEELPKPVLSKNAQSLFVEKGPMLDEYFSTKIDSNGNLCSIPLLLEQFSPGVSGMPIFMLNVATNVDWENEKECFDSFSRQVAQYYSQQFLDDVWMDGASSTPSGDKEKNLQWTIEHVIYPAIRRTLLPPKWFAEDGTILQIANLPDLYKLFERC